MGPISTPPRGRSLVFPWLCAAAFAACPAFAQSPAAPPTTLPAIDLTAPPAAEPTAVAPAAAKPDAPPPAAAAGLTPDEVKNLIERALAERDAKAKQAEGETKSWDVGANRKMTGTWNNGVSFESDDKAFRLTVGGVTQFDMGWYGASKNQVRSVGLFNNYADPNQALQDGMDFRRARLRISGVAFEQIEYYAQYEFANAIDLRQRTLGIANGAGVANPILTNTDPAETVGFNELYFGLTKLPFVGTVRVGRHRESLNFVTATNDNFQIWMERGLMFDAFNGNTNFSNGVTVSNTYLDGRAYALFGFFEQNSFSNKQFSTVGDGNYVYDGRITGLPISDEENQRWLHVGADYSYRNLSQDNVRIRARPDVRVGSSFQVPNLVDTGTIYSRDAEQIANLEFASAFGPWTFAAEATGATVTNAYTGGLPLPGGKLPSGVAAHGTYVSTGAYVELMYFLTPDHRPYVQDRPGYGRVTPSRRFFWVRGDDGGFAWDSGAWEVGVRFDYVDLTHGGINGGTARGITGAVNWYLSSNARIQANLSWTQRDFNPGDAAGRQSGDITAFGLRFNVDF